jgi:PAS domain S-box-containing protein
MNETHAKILSILAQKGRSLKIKEIAALTQLDPHTAARNLDVLEVLGKVRKIVVGTSKKYHLIESIPVFSLIDISSDLIVILDTSLSIQYINKKAKEFLRLEDMHVIGEKLEILSLDLFSGPEILDGLTKFSFEKVYRTEIPYEYLGKKLWYAISIIGLSLSLNDRKIAIIAEDITEKKLFQQKTIDSEEMLRSITHNIPGIVFRYNIRTKVHEFFNDNLEKLTGYSLKEITSHHNIPFYSIIHSDDIHNIEPIISESIKTGNEYNIQYKIIKKDRAIIHAHEQGRVIFNQAGNPEYIDGIIYECSEIIEIAARYRNLFQSAPIAIVEDNFSQFYSYVEKLRKTGVSDFNNYFRAHPEAVFSCQKLIKNVEYNSEFLRLLELDQSEVSNFFSKSSIFIPESIQTIRELFIALAEGRLEFQGEIPIKTSKGNILQVIVHVSVVAGVVQPLSRVLISCIDNTHRKKIREELCKSKRNLQAIFDNTYCSFVLIDKTYKIQAFNASAAQGSINIFNRTMSIDDSILAYVREEDKLSFLSHFNMALAGEKIQTELQYILKDGIEYWFEFHYSPVYDVNGIVDAVFFTTHDITDKKRTQETLLQTERERLLLAEEAGKQGIYEINVKTDKVIFSPAFYSMHGYPPGTLQSTTDIWPTRIHPDDNLRLTRDRVSSLKNENTFSSEYRIKHHNGSWMWVEGRSRVIRRDEEGDPEIIIGIHTDITSRKLTDEALKESEMRLRQIADATDEALFMHAEGKIYEVNSSAVKIFGYSEQELKATSVLSLVSPEYREYVSERLSENNQEDIYETDGITKDGKILKLRVKATNIRSGNDTIRFSAVKDITKQKENERKFQIAHLDLQAAYEQISATEEELRANCDELLAKTAELEESKKLLNLKLDHILTPDCDITDEELSNIIDCEEIQRIMDDFYALSGIGVAIVDLKGKILVATGWQDICTRFHRVHPQTAKNCLESDLSLSTNIKPGEVRAYKCKNNLWDIATPIMIGVRHVGNLFLGQFFFTDDVVDREVFRNQAQKYGFDIEAYLAALDRVPRWNREMVDKVIDFYKRFARLISKLSYSNLKLAKTLTDYERIMQQLSKSQEKYRRYCEFSPHGILVADRAGQIADVNPMTCSMLGYSRDDLMSMGIESLYPDENKSLLKERFLSLIRTGYSSFETKMQRKDDTDIPILLSAVSLPDDMYIAFIIDLTEREEAKQREASALEQIEKNMHQFAALNDQIRNPLTIINGMCEIDEPAHYEQIKEQILKIDQIIRQVDQGWLESIKIREYLRKHHGIILDDIS